MINKYASGLDLWPSDFSAVSAMYLIIQSFAIAALCKTCTASVERTAQCQITKQKLNLQGLVAVKVPASLNPFALTVFFL